MKKKTDHLKFPPPEKLLEDLFYEIQGYKHELTAGKGFANLTFKKLLKNAENDFAEFESLLANGASPKLRTEFKTEREEIMAILQTAREHLEKLKRKRGKS
ncbi:MAG: hypothetical protein ABIG60_04995 [Patescibacteria group bacterium]